MALFNPSELKAWRYCVRSCIFLIDDTTISVDPECITGIEIYNNYYTDTFPIFKVNFLLESSIYYKIYKNKTKLKIKLRIQKYYKTYDNNYKSLTKDFINDLFVTIDDANDVDRESDYDLYENIHQSSSDDALDRYDSPLELYLYRAETDTALKTQINNILKDVTMSSAIGYILGTSGIKNALVSPLENNKTYKELLLPPLTTNRLLAHLDASYGFYKYGSVIFFGIDRTYILNFKGGCTVFEKGEKKETCIYIPKSMSIESAAGGTIEKNDDRHYINWQYKQVLFKNPSVSADVIAGSDALVINPNTGSKIISNSKVNTNGIANTAIIDNESENPWLGTTFTAQSSSNALIVYGAMADIDLSALTPNKKFTLIFEDSALTSKYKGIYFLSSSMFKFMNDSAKGDFSIIASVEFRRMQQTSSNESYI